MARTKRGELDIKDSKFLKTARERWKAADDADNKQALREQEDLSFYDDDQWPADVKLARMGQQPVNGMPAVPSRPTIVINKVREPVRQVQNEMRNSDIGIELVPADDFGDLGITPDDTEITLREGLIRRIQRESEAQAARNWAGDRATICGRGFHLVSVRYLPGKTWDQEVYVHRIYNQAGVKLDPAHEQPDGSDSDWGFVGSWVSLDKLTATKPSLANGKDNPLLDCNADDFMGMTEKYPEWFKADGDGEKKRKSVRIVDYWYTSYETRTLCLLSDLSAAWEGELPKKLPNGLTVVDTRTVSEPHIKYAQIAGGVLVFDESEWAGPDIPIIKTLGEEIQPYDEQRRAEGMVRPARGAQMAYNYMISKLVETVGLTPIPPLMVDPEAIEGFEKWYGVANTRTLPYLPSRSYNDQGQQLKEPHRPNVDPNLQPMAVAIGVFDQSIKSTTSVPDSSLGNVDPALKSGKAIDAVVANAKMSTSNFLDNRVVSTRREGTIINNLLYPIYGSKPGRLVRILTGEGAQQQFQIGASTTTQNPTDAANLAKAAKVGKLTEHAQFNIIVKVTKEWESRRQQEAAALGELMSASPEMISVVGDLWAINSDMPGRKAIAERFRAMLAPQIQKMLAEKEQGEAIPPKAAQKIAQLEEQVQMADAALKELAKDAEGKQLDAQTKIEVQRLTTERDLMLKRLELEFEKYKVDLESQTKIQAANIAAESKEVLAAQSAAHTSVENDKDRQSSERQDITKMAHDAAKTDADADRAEQENARAREATAVENERNRKAQPKGPK